ncbi:MULTISPECIES: antitermination protein Q [Rahnella]|uniref:antitermination protein n=1 Tax=Rahnella TaxID=34037 RepID=UPI003F6DBDCF
MNLETILKHFSPKGLSISDSSRATASDALNITDIMAALGMTQSGAEFGLRLFLAKAGISQQDKTIAVGMLTQYAKQHAPKHIGKVAGRRMAECLRIMAKMAFEDYARSAAAKSDCPCCSGTGFLKEKRTFRNQLAIDRREYLDALPGNLGLLYRDEMKSKTEGEDIVDVICQPCKGKGVISSRCRCNGTGKVVDREKSILMGLPVEKECPRCHGVGYSRLPASIAHRAVKALLPELPERTWNNSWKPFYEKLITKCFIEESAAESEFKKVTQ